MLKPIFLVGSLLFVTMTAHAQDKFIAEDFVSSPFTATLNFSCEARGESYTIDVEYETARSATRDEFSAVRKLSVNGKEIPKNGLKMLNAIVGSDTVAEVTAGCTSDRVRVLVTAFRPKNVPRGECLAKAFDPVQVYFDVKTQQFDVR